MRAGGRASVGLLLAVGVVFWAGEARAQWTNASIGVDAGAVAAYGLGLSAGAALGLESGVYLGSGFELAFRGRTSLHGDRVGGGTAAIVQPGVGLRYLFSEELLRPYAGVEVGSMIFIGSTAGTLLFGAGYAGLEYYVAVNTAVGLQLEYERAFTQSAGTLGTLARITWGF